MRLLNLNYCSPTVVIAGSVELGINKTTNQPMLKGKVDLSLEPLIGIELKVNLIRAFAAQYNLHYVVGNIENAMEQAKERVVNGESGAYLTGKFEMIVAGIIDVGLSFFYDEDSKFDYQLLDNTEGRLSIGGKIDIQAGGRALMISGYFVAGGSFTAEGCCWLQRRPVVNDNDGLDLVFYHNGIEMKFWAAAGFGERQVDSRDSSISHDNNVVIGKVNTDIQQNDDGDSLLEYTWQIAKKLEEEYSTYKVQII